MKSPTSTHKKKMDPPLAEASTQTDNQKRVAKLASPVYKSIGTHTEPVCLERYSIKEATSQLLTDSKENERKEEEKSPNAHKSKEEGEECEDGEEDEDAFNLENELQRRLNPKTLEDFELLQAELLQWKQHQNRKIQVTARNPSHKKEMTKRLLEDEARLIRKIETLKAAASETWKLNKLEKIMEELSMTQQWGSISVETPEIRRAREMKDVFGELKKTVVNGKLYCCRLGGLEHTSLHHLRKTHSLYLRQLSWRQNQSTTKRKGSD